jgi:hypothetical protein
MSQPVPAPSPNARIVPDQIRADTILCCGEDKATFVAALLALGFPADATAAPEFRGYTTWTLPHVSIVLAPIGTGALEPILHELLETGRITRLLLVGTAGRLSARPLPLGVGYAITEAHLAGTGLDRELGDAAQTPIWPTPLPGPAASIVSSDFYYGFSPARRAGDYRHRLPALRKDFERLSSLVDLVDMEVGQFYALCRLIPDTPGLRFLAIKGASNGVENHAEQNTHAPAVLLDCLRKAFAALDRPTSPPA